MKYDKITIDGYEIPVATAFKIHDRVEAFFNSDATEPKHQPKTPQAYKRVAPPYIPRRVKFFIALIYNDAKRHGEDFFELLKNPRDVARRYGRESECTPLVEARTQEWAWRVKPESALVEARRWLKENRESVELGRYKDTVDGSVYGANIL